MRERVQLAWSRNGKYHNSEESLVVERYRFPPFKRAPIFFSPTTSAGVSNVLTAGRGATNLATFDDLAIVDGRPVTGAILLLEYQRPSAAWYLGQRSNTAAPGCYSCNIMAFSMDFLPHEDHQSTSAQKLQHSFPLQSPIASLHSFPFPLPCSSPPSPFAPPHPLNTSHRSSSPDFSARSYAPHIPHHASVQPVRTPLTDYLYFRPLREAPVV